MLDNPIGAIVERAISHIIGYFQKYPERFWNERDIHWSLFYYLKQEAVCSEAYPTELIRAEFPTVKVFSGKKPARGHYDLVILDAESYFKPEVQNMKAPAPWKEYLELVQVTVAIEIKLWLNRLRPANMAERADWDIQKLTDTPNNVQNAYFLNFVQLNFKSEYMRQYYQQLHEYLSNKKGKHLDLNILCVPSDYQLQPGPNYWL